MICPNCGYDHKPKESAITSRKKALRIKEICLQFYNVTETELLSDSRKKEIVACRHMIMGLIRRHSAMSQKTIGDFIKRERTTVIHAEQRLENSLFTKGDLYDDILHLESLLENNLKVA